MKRLLFVSLTLLAGCFSPDDIFVVTGTVTTAQPEGQLVRMLRGKPDAFNACGEFKAFKEATTDAEGGFTFEVFRAQALSLTGFTTNFCFRVETEFPSGTRAFTVLPQLFGPETLPALRDWQPSTALDAGTLVFTPAAPLPAHEAFEGDQVVHRLEARTADGGLAWQQDDYVLSAFEAMPSPLRVPLRFDDAVMLEDEALTLRLRARVQGQVLAEGPFGGGQRFGPIVELEAGEALLVAAGRAPPTRGLACPSVSAPPCDLTDGDLTSRSPGFGVTRVVLPLPTPLTPRWVVLRGLESNSSLLSVQLGLEDGGVAPFTQVLVPVSLWNPAEPPVQLPLDDGGVLRRGDAPQVFLAVPLDGGVSASSVRVTDPAGIERIAELSVLE